MRGGGAVSCLFIPNFPQTSPSEYNRLSKHKSAWMICLSYIGYIHQRMRICDKASSDVIIPGESACTFVASTNISTTSVQHQYNTH